MKALPSLAKVVLPDDLTLEAEAKRRSQEEEKLKMAMGKIVPAPEQHTGHADAVERGLRNLAQLGTVVHLAVGEHLLMQEDLSDCFLAVMKGGLEVRSNASLIERLESLPPKKIRIRVTVERGDRLAGNSIFDKLDPYCIVRL